jgi:hypothetical protein
MSRTFLQVSLTMHRDELLQALNVSQTPFTKTGKLKKILHVHSATIVDSDPGPDLLVLAHVFRCNGPTDRYQGMDERLRRRCCRA